MKATATPLFPQLDHDEGAAYLATRKLEEKRSSGAVYTPPSLAQFILRSSGYGKNLEDTTKPLLDPACGAGVFLAEATDLMARELARAGDSPSSQRGRRLLLSRIRRNLFGIDIDGEACELARRAVRQRVKALTGKPAPSGFFGDNVVEADFLALDLGSVNRRLKSGVGFVVGNPPYVQTTRLTAAEKDKLRARFKTAFGRIDLYALFIERSLEVLCEGGLLGFVTPDKFLMGKSMAPLREVILERAALREVARFRSHKVFASAATVPCVTVLQRGRRTRTIEVSECLHRGNRVEVLRRSKVKANERLLPEGWNLLHPTFLELATRIRAQHPHLETLAERISAGYATGRDKIFVLTDEEARKIEPELLHPVVRGRDVSQFQVSSSGKQVILPYVFPEGRKPALVDLSAYPKAERYLRGFRESLESRHCVRTWNKSWYDIHDPVSLNLSQTPKILVPDVASGNRFAFDSGQLLPLHSAYYIVPSPGQDPLYLTALLNSRPLEFLIQLVAPVVKDGFRRYRRQFLANLPVPSAPRATVKRIVEYARAGDLDGLNRQVESLLGLSAVDIDLMAEYLAAQKFPHKAS